jgi:D-glycero-alpha-D-manno-heptose-7-phosphate kinase
MIIAKCPLRIGLVGGSSDLQAYIEKHNAGAVVNFSVDLYTYVTLSKDIGGFNALENRYIVGYSKREEVDAVVKIKNDVVREAFKHFDVSPCTTMLTTDVYSSGSGLASSSSYLISLIAAIRKLQGNPTSQYEICHEAMLLERNFNPLLGWQDTFGCGLPGLKRFDFSKTLPPTVQNLKADMFEDVEIYLVPTGVNRSSTKVLKTIQIPKDSALLTLVDDMTRAIRDEDLIEFSRILKEGWTLKKASSKKILENERVKEIDDALAASSSVLCHKLCGAGNGGFFLFFKLEDEKMKIPPGAIRVNIDYAGVTVTRL